MKKAVRIGDTNVFQIKELQSRETETGSVDVWIDIERIVEDHADNELTSNQDQIDRLLDRQIILADNKELINDAIQNEA